MNSVEVRVGGGDLFARMNGMRMWLDSRHFEPAAFRYQHAGDIVVIQVEFAVDAEAVAFADEFKGRLSVRP